MYLHRFQNNIVCPYWFWPMICTILLDIGKKYFCRKTNKPKPKQTNILIIQLFVEVMKCKTDL